MLRNLPHVIDAIGLFFGDVDWHAGGLGAWLNSAPISQATAAT
jgi:hypothetical protein